MGEPNVEQHQNFQSASCLLINFNITQAQVLDTISLFNHVLRDFGGPGTSPTSSRDSEQMNCWLRSAQPIKDSDSGGSECDLCEQPMYVVYPLAGWLSPLVAAHPL